MFNVSKNVLQVICENLTVNDSGRLKMVCKYFNEAIEIVNVRMYACAIDKNNVPIKAKYNCLKVSVKHLKHKFIFQTLKNEFYSDSYRLLAITIWGQMKNDKGKSLNDKGHFDGENVRPRDFLSTTIQIKQDVSFIEEGRKVVWKLSEKHSNLSTSHVDYIQKELRYVQQECWQFPYPHTTSLELKNSFDELNLTDNPIIGDISKITVDSQNNNDCRYLVLRCVAGDVFTKTIETLLNTLERFGFKLD